MGLLALANDMCNLMDPPFTDDYLELYKTWCCCAAQVKADGKNLWLSVPVTPPAFKFGGAGRVETHQMCNDFGGWQPRHAGPIPGGGITISTATTLTGTRGVGDNNGKGNGSSNLCWASACCNCNGEWNNEREKQGGHIQDLSYGTNEGILSRAKCQQLLAHLDGMGKTKVPQLVPRKADAIYRGLGGNAP